MDALEGTQRGETPCDFFPEATASACYDHCLAFELHVQLPSIVTWLPSLTIREREQSPGS
jgi:hypothetical protein